MQCDRRGWVEGKTFGLVQIRLRVDWQILRTSNSSPGSMLGLGLVPCRHTACADPLGCWCAIRPASARRQRFSAPTWMRHPQRSSAGSSHAGGSKPPSSEVRTHLGVETQRQWSDLVILRTTPALLGLFSLITVWDDGLARDTSTALRPNAAVWYRKQEPSFSDAIAALRRVVWCPPDLSMSGQIGEISRRTSTPHAQRGRGSAAAAWAVEPRCVARSPCTCTHHGTASPRAATPHSQRGRRPPRRAGRRVPAPPRGTTANPVAARPLPHPMRRRLVNSETIRK